jgi:hypothetical protein
MSFEGYVLPQPLLIPDALLHGHQEVGSSPPCPSAMMFFLASGLKAMKPVDHEVKLLKS